MSITWTARRRVGDGGVDMDGYDAASYGDGIADVYDEWYADVSDVAATVGLVARLATAAGSARVLELGAGTGRLAIPLTDAGLHVTGVDASTAMLDRLRKADPAGRVSIVHGDMVDDLPDGPFGVVLVAYNTLFNLTDAGRQRACVAAAAERLVVGGALVIEAFVPADPPPSGDDVRVRDLCADRVVLSITRHHPDQQRAEGQFVEFTAAGGVRLRPWAIRYAAPDELDAMAAAAGLHLAERWAAPPDEPFDADSTRHTSVYRR
jgi:SAM-dependent methyltransferase